MVAEKMSHKIISCSFDPKERSGALFGVQRLIASHVDFVHRSSKADATLVYGFLPKNFLIKRKRSICLPLPHISENKLEPSPIVTDRFDTCVYPSSFWKQIVESHPKTVCKYGVVIPCFGGLPSDLNINPVMKRSKPTGTIHIGCCAKWLKRPFKRRKQIVQAVHAIKKKAYSDVHLHVFGNHVEDTVTEDCVTFYRKSFVNTEHADLYRNLISVFIHLSSFDSGPAVISESIFYRIPFIVSNNCGAKEYNDLTSSKCGVVVNLDEQISSYKDCLRINPFHRKVYGVPINNDIIVDSFSQIMDDYDNYVNWEYTPKYSSKHIENMWLSVLT